MYPWVSVVHRPKKDGLGPAYLAGFRRALEQGADLVLTMDCDFQHDPGDVPRLIEAAEDADLVIGSRYVDGGGFDGAFVRRVLSRGGSTYARAMLGGPVRDVSGGFRCFRRATLEAIDLDAFQFGGYGFHIEATYRVLRAGFCVREVPIHFAQRRAGRSKLSGGIVSEAIWKVPALRALAAAGRLDGARAPTRAASEGSYDFDPADLLPHAAGTEAGARAGARSV
jgi:dolichol-phosphate mannosyltransferase